MQIKNLRKIEKKLTIFFSKIDPVYVQNAKPIAIAFCAVFFSFLIITTWVSRWLATYNQSLVKQLKVTEIELKTTTGGWNSNIEKNIIGRNIFNLAGNIPFEDMDSDDESFILKNFDRVPCTASEKAPVDLVGIIYTENGKTNLVTLKDSQATDADVYHEGDAIIGHTGYFVYKVTTPISVQLRKKKTKICMSLPHTNDLITEEGFPVGNVENSENYPIELDFVKSELGEGFSKILTAARLVPEVVDDKMQGFKIFSINPGTLFERIKLENGDIIQSVNGVNLQDPEQGFKIYEAFQDENNITLNVLRNGVVITKKVTVQ